MKMSYDHQADALYLTLSDHPHARSKMISDTCALDFDADGQVIGIELLQVKKSGIDPMQFSIEYLSAEKASGGPVLTPANGD